MKHHKEMEQLIERDIADPDQRQACIDIVDTLSNDDDERQKHTYKFNQIFKKVKFRNTKESIFNALIYLSGSKNKFLNQHYQFIDDFGQLFDLDHEIVTEAIENNEFFHPETGEQVENFDQKIFLVYLINHD